MNANELLDWLEELLSISGQFVDQMDRADQKTWQRISAQVADLREGDQV